MKPGKVIKMKNHVLDTNNTDLSKAYKYSNGNAASSFYMHDLDDAQLMFTVEEEDGAYTVTPTVITYKIKHLNSGAKITVEVLNNGYTVKKGSDSFIVGDLYDLRTKMEELSISEDDYRVDYDPEVHSFSNIDAIITNLIEELENS